MAFRIATFNAGLAVGVLPHVTERVPPVISALGALDVDVLWVQEFWLESHWERLCRELRPRFAHAFRPEPTQSRSRAACRETDLAALRKCAETHCAGLTDEALARCVVRNCAPHALALPSECLNCIASSPVGSFEEIVARCLESDAEPTVGSPPLPTTAGELIAYGGSFGTGLLARTPFDGPRTLVFESSINARGAIATSVTLGKLGKVFLFATHFSPGGAEQQPQVVRLLSWITEVAGQAPAILLGDLNTTPGSSLFALFERAGFHEPKESDRRATFTHEGLQSGRVESSGYRLDHILVRGIPAVKTERILDQPVTLSVAGRAVRSTLSDHFGVLAVVDDSVVSRA
jgi:endonuclease/exonuclease/phosphatase family metal-dependent hydrolase